MSEIISSVIEYFTSLFSSPLMAVAQTFGFMAMAGAIICFQQKNRDRILIWQIVVTVLWTIHFILLKSPTGAAINAMQVVRSIIFLNKDKHAFTKWNGWPVVFTLITVALGIVTWEGPMSILPIIGTTFSTVSLWMKKPLTIRLLTLPVSVTWGIYDLLSGSVAGCCNETIAIINIIIAIFRVDLRKKPEDTAKEV